VADFKPNHDVDEYRHQSLLALAATNLYSSLPAPEDLPEDIAELLREMRRRVPVEHLTPATVTAASSAG
jgi:hypothetical protein